MYAVYNLVGSSIICTCDGCKWGLSAVGCDGLAYVPGCFWVQSISSCQNQESNSRHRFSSTMLWISSAALTNQTLSNHEPRYRSISPHDPQHHPSTIWTTDWPLMLTQNLPSWNIHRVQLLTSLSDKTLHTSLILLIYSYAPCTNRVIRPILTWTSRWKHDLTGHQHSPSELQF